MVSVDARPAIRVQSPLSQQPLCKATLRGSTHPLGYFFTPHAQAMCVRSSAATAAATAHPYPSLRRPSGEGLPADAFPRGNFFASERRRGHQFTFFLGSWVLFFETMSETKQRRLPQERKSQGKKQPPTYRMYPRTHPYGLPNPTQSIPTQTNPMGICTKIGELNLCSETLHTLPYMCPRCAHEHPNQRPAAGKPPRGTTRSRRPSAR